MATNQALAIFDPAAVPSFVAEAIDAGDTNIVTRASTNSLTFSGKVWSITLEGNKRPLMKKNEEGEDEPVQIFNAVILAYPERRGRAYYEGAYDPEKESTPVCWSNDGVDSDPNAPKRQSEKCAKCPMSAKGSRQSDNGKAMTACGQHRHVAVVPSSRLGDFPPMRLKLAITSDFDSQDKEAQANGWYAFQNYMDFLKSKRVPFTYMLTTRIKFDPKVAYPKLLFAPGKWLTEDQYAATKELAAHPDIEGLLKTEYTPSNTDDVAAPAGLSDEEEEDGLGAPTVSAKPAAAAPAKPKAAAAAAPAAAAPAKAKAKPAAAPAPVPDDDDEEVVQAAPVKPAKAKPAAAPAPVPDDDDEEVVQAAPVKPAKPAAPAVNPKAAQALAAAAARKAAPVLDEDGEEVLPAAKPAKASGKAATATPPVASSPAVEAVLGDWDD